MYICMYVCIYVYVYAYIYIYICMLYIHTPGPRKCANNSLLGSFKRSQTMVLFTVGYQVFLIITISRTLATIPDQTNGQLIVGIFWLP